MPTSFSWNIKVMTVKPVEGSLTDVVIVVYWDRLGSRASNSVTYNASRSGMSNLGTPDPYNFTPYDQLTENQVIGWVETSLGTEQLALIDASIDKDIDNQINPPVEVLPPPWQQ